LEAGALTNSKTGDLFGITYSSVNYRVNTTRLKLEKKRQLKNNFNHIYSLF
jgi:hypothetical protein